MVFPGVDMVAIVGITLLAATVTGALGYGFSSLILPVALLFYSNKILNPALVLVALVVNSYTLIINRKSLSKVWKRVFPILLGLVPGVLAGSYILFIANPGWVKFFTYVILLPLILVQAAGLRRPFHFEKAVGVPLGVGVGTLYSVTTISGPPLAVMFNNQGFVKEEFRAALGLVRVTEAILTAIAYYFLGLYSVTSTGVLSFIVPSVVLGLPLGAFLIKHMHAETFRRMCMSFDAWIVGFGLAKVLIDLKLLAKPMAYSVWFSVIATDLYLLYLYFKARMRNQ